MIKSETNEEKIRKDLIMAEECVIFHNMKDKEIYDMDLRYNKTRGSLVIASIADIHMGKIDPKTQYDILKEQFLNIINELPKLDIIASSIVIFMYNFLSV